MRQLPVQSPSFPACYQPGPDPSRSHSQDHPDDRNPHFGADSRPHGRHPAARQAAVGYRRPADDRARAAPGRSRPDRPRRGRHRHAGDRGGRHIPWRRSRHDAAPIIPPVRTGFTRRSASSIPKARSKPSSMCRATCRPFRPTRYPRRSSRSLDDPAVDIGTLAAEIRTGRRAHQPERGEADRLAAGRAALRALYFTRATAPYGDGPRYHHIGLYAYRRAALERFVTLPPSVAGKAREARTVAGAGSRHADRRGHRGLGAARRRYAGRSRNRPPDAGEKLSGCYKAPAIKQRPSNNIDDQNHENCIPGRTRRQLPYRHRRSLSRGRAAALPDLRRRLGRDQLRRGRPRHDPDREFGRRTRRRYPPSVAAIRPVHRRRMVSSRSIIS